MWIEPPHTYECGPARRVGERRVAAPQVGNLGFPQRHDRIAFRPEGAMKVYEEAMANLVVDVPEAAHDVGHARGKKWPA